VKISCPSCSAKYSIADEKVQSRLAKIRCRKCGATIVIDGKVSPPQVTASAGDSGDAHTADHAVSGGSEYSVDFGSGDQRTLSIADIVSAYNSGQITGETFLWADGFADWKPLSEVQEVVDALHGGAPAPVAAAPAPAASPFGAKPQPSPIRAAARPARAATADLFGRIESAGSEEDIATSAPDAAAAFAGGGGGAAVATGSRNESSVLFSLSALTSAATQAKPSSPGRSSATTAASREDSGLIDLKALTAAAVKADGGGAPAAAAPAMGMGLGMAGLGAPPLGVAPLGLGAPLGAGLGLEAPMPQKSKTALYIAIAIVVAAVIVAVAFILRPPPPAPAVVAPPPVPTAAPTPTPTPTPTLAATPPATGSAGEEADAGAKKTPRRYTGKVGAKAPTTDKGSGDTSSGTSDKPPPPKSGSCGCAPTDLMCNMRCKSKK
jgi:predicted Zn finger-like uncharacterized protein